MKNLFEIYRIVKLHRIKNPLWVTFRLWIKGWNAISFHTYMKSMKHGFNYGMTPRKFLQTCK